MPATQDLPSADRERWLRLASRASVATAFFLIALKAVAWVYTDSVSLLASLVDSAMDAAASVINLLAIRYALVPADEEHRFGHGKAEALAGLGQSAFIAGSAAFLMLHAVERILHPAPVDAPDIGVAVMLVSILATGALVLLQRMAIARTRSTAIAADSLHYVGDLLTNASVLLALLLVMAGYAAIDAWMGIAIACWILWSAWQIAAGAFDHLLDREVEEPVREEIARVALSCAGVQGVHALRTRQSGHTLFVQMHVEIDRDTPLWQAHAVAEAVEERVRERFPGSDVIVHQDPAPLPGGPAGDVRH